MERHIQNIFKVTLMGLVVLATGCSEVAFDPTPEAAELLGIPDGAQREVFMFNGDESQAKVDVLFVVDNSGSMVDEQTKLSTRLASFVGMLGKIDWQIGVTTTDVSDGPYGIKGGLVPFKGAGVKVINKHTPNASEVFRNTIVRDELLNCTDVCPSADERPLEATMMAINKRNGENAGFFRDNSDFVVVILSDEDERSDGINATSPDAVVDTFRASFVEGKRITGFGIVIQPGDTTCYNAQSANAGKYAYITSGLPQITGGATGSICDDDYGPTLASIGERVRDSVESITLRNMPLPDSIQLRIKPFDPDLTWAIEGQTIRFNRPPKKGTQIDVIYMRADGVR